MITTVGRLNKELGLFDGMMGRFTRQFLPSLLMGRKEVLGKFAPCIRVEEDLGFVKAFPEFTDNGFGVFLDI